MIYREGEPEDIAGSLFLLASDKAGWITGQTITATEAMPSGSEHRDSLELESSNFANLRATFAPLAELPRLDTRPPSVEARRASCSVLV